MTYLYYIRRTLPMLKKRARFILTFIMSVILLTASVACVDMSGVPVFEDGMAQPVLEYSDLRDTGYTNDGSDILRYCVYVETDHDTDADGKADLVKVLMQVPRAAAEGRYRAATIYDPTPYGAGTVDAYTENTADLYNPVPFDYEVLYAPGEKREPKGSMTTLEAAEYADPESWNYTVPYSDSVGFTWAGAYDYFLVRGFAVAEAGGIGTYGSEGFELCGMDLERDAHKCVVEWLAGNRIAYTDPYNDIEIAADWSNGNIAMTGCSYGGTLPYEVATTGVEGLKTIVPFAGIASWYDYTNSQGVPLRWFVNYADQLASSNAGAAFIDDDWTVINDDYASFLWQMSEDQDRTNGDYDEIWAISDYSQDTENIDCSALIVHGLNDFNVLTRQSDMMAQAFEKAGRPYKLVLHQDGHNVLNGHIVNGELWQDLLNKWYSHYLYGVDNGIEDMAEVTFQSNVDGSYSTCDSWRDFNYESFPYDTSEKPEAVSKIDTTHIAEHFDTYYSSTDEYGRTLTRDSFYLSMPDPTSSCYTYELPDDFTIYGVPELHLKMASEDPELDGLMVSAMLIDTIDNEENFKAYLTKEMLYDALPTKTVDVYEIGGNAGYGEITEYVKSNTRAKLITFGYTDLNNYGCGYNSFEYTKKTAKMEKGKYYDYTIYLQPTVYTVEPGHRLVLVVTGWDPYIVGLDEDYNNGLIEDPEDSQYTYSFSIDNKALDFRLPCLK